MAILFVNACVREDSRTKRLANAVLKKLDGEIIEVNLEKENIQPLNNQTLAERSKLIAEKKYEHEIFRYARQFAQADMIVIAAPFWDLSFPAMLKCYIEAVNVVGIVFKYTENGIIGLGRAKKLVYVATSGGEISEDNCGFGYIKRLANMMYKIPELQFFKAECLDIIGNDVEKILQKSLAEINQSKI